MSDDADAQAHAAVLARTTARVLALGVWLAALCIALTAFAVWQAAVSHAAWAVAVALGAVALYYAARVRLDQQLFEDLGSEIARGASGPAALARLDAALATLRLRRRPQPAPALEQRARAAAVLLVRLAALVAAQLALTLVLLRFFR